MNILNSDTGKANSRPSSDPHTKERPIQPDSVKPQTSNKNIISSNNGSNSKTIQTNVEQQANKGLNTSNSRSTENIANNILSAQIKRIETSITKATTLSQTDVNRLSQLLSKEQLANLLRTHITTQTAKSITQNTNTGLDLLSLKVNGSNESLAAIAKSGLQIGTKVQVEMPTLATPKLILLTEKSSLTNSSTKLNTLPITTHHETLTINKRDSVFTDITRKALVDIGLRKYLPQQIDKNTAVKLISQIITAKQPLVSTNTENGSKLQLATTEVIKTLGRLEHVGLNLKQGITPHEVKKALFNSGIFLEAKINSDIKNNINKIMINQNITSLNDNPAGQNKTSINASTINTHLSLGSKVSTTAGALLNKTTNQTLLNSGSEKNHAANGLTTNIEALKQQDIKAILLNMISTITTLQNVTSANVLQPTLNLNGFDKLLKTLLNPGSSKNDPRDTQKKVLENIKTIANNVLTRISTNQLQGLNKNQTDGTISNSVSLDIPIKIGENFLPLHMQIEERSKEKPNDDNNQNPDQKNDHKKRTNLSSWHVILEFSFLDQGDFFSEIEVIGDKLKSTIWAEKKEYRAKLEQQLPRLYEQLTSQGIEVDELRSLENKPAGKTNQIRHHLVDIKT